MKKICFILLILSLTLTSCGKITNTKDFDSTDTSLQSAESENTDTAQAVASTEVTGNQYLFSPISLPKEMLANYNMMVVQWGEPVADVNCMVLDRTGLREISYIGITVNYVRLFDVTLSKSFVIDATDRFKNIPDGEELREVYDDIILVPENYLPKLVKGETAFTSVKDVSLVQNKKDVIYYRVVDPFNPNPVDIWDTFILPFEQNVLIIPWEAYVYMIVPIPGEYRAEGGYVFSPMEALTEVNTFLKFRDYSYPTFGSGMTIEELDDFFGFIENYEISDYYADFHP